MATSLTELLAAMQNGVQAINSLPGRMGFATTATLSFYAFNSVSSSPTQVVAGSTGTTYPANLSFHNPSDLDIFVYPSVDGNGNSITALSSSPGGALLVYANGGSISIDGGSTMAWFAISTGTAGSLTVVRDA
jgi:hypothetical protein